MNTKMDEDTQDDYPFAALQNAIRAFMRTHPVGACSASNLQFFKQLWKLYGDYNINVEYHGGQEFEADVLKYLQQNLC